MRRNRWNLLAGSTLVWMLGGWGGLDRGSTYAAEPRPASRTATQAAAATRPATAPRTMMEALAPIRQRLPKSNARVAAVVIAGSDIDLAYIPLAPPFMATQRQEQQQQAATKATRHIAGFAGTDGTLQGESVSVMAFTLTDPAVAKQLPALFADGFRSMRPLMKRAGVSLNQLDVVEPPGVVADAARMVRAAGRDTDANKPWANVQLRAVRGPRMVEVVLRNVAMPEQEMIALVNDALDRVASLPPDAEAQAAPPAPEPEADER